MALKHSFLIGFCAGIALASGIGYFAFTSDLHNIHAADAKRAGELIALTNKYKADAATAQANERDARAALAIATSGVGAIVSGASTAHGQSTIIADGTRGDLDLARQIDAGLQPPK